MYIYRSNIINIYILYIHTQTDCTTIYMKNSIYKAHLFTIFQMIRFYKKN